ncbi:MAG: iron-sulfur cluster repair protein YtfE [Polaromonas sp.]
MSAREKFETASVNLADLPLGQLAVDLPGASAVFRKLKLDFCCGGLVSLRQAALDKKLDLADVVSQLTALQRPDALPENQTPAALIDHIISRYHEVHRVQLPELVRMARRVEAVHREHPEVPSGLADLLEEMEQELLGHMQKEEAILFPLLKSGGSPYASQPIGVMRAEHTSHGQALDQVHALSHDMQPPEGACNTWRALYTGIGQFTDDLINHIHLENNVLFPAFEAARESGCGSAGGCGCQ